ncbi:HNH endonuclease [Agrobacterium vitis]|nr:HNH endonuclease [Allorhizobium ampelinum]MCF1449725.1 HNH endonuclease [Allorhizobium ampelinum]
MGRLFAFKDMATDQRSDEAKGWRSWYYTTRWRAIRAIQLKREPYCRMCRQQGKLKKGFICDHIERHSGNAEKFWNGPFQTLCKKHHDATKQREEHRGFSTAMGANGWPTDPRHPANRT